MQRQRVCPFEHSTMRPLRFYLGVFFISFAALMLEIVQTRILSVVVWYHLAFFVISLAMFGLTAGAVWVYLKGERFTEKTLSYDLGYFTGLFALATAICLASQMTLAPVISRLVTTLWIWTELALCLSIPFFFAGVAISLALTRSSFPIARVYGVDLLGAASGAVGALLLLNATDGPSAVLWVAVFAAARRSIVLDFRDRRCAAARATAAHMAVASSMDFSRAVLGGGD